VEVLSPCPTIWKLDPVDAQRFVREEMAGTFPIANLRDHTKTVTPRAAHAAPPALEELPAKLGLVNGTSALVEGAAAVPAEGHPATGFDMRIKVAGFGGQGVLMLGEVLAEGGLDAGCHVSWLPSYGPEMRSGTSNCHVRLAAGPIDSPLVSRSNVLLALNEPSLRKFLPSVEPGGIVLYNGPAMPEDCVRGDVRQVALPFTEIADGLGVAKAGNIVMLGALVEATGLLEEAQVVSALRKIVKSQKWFDIDMQAFERGRQEIRKQPLPVGDEYLWGV